MYGCGTYCLTLREDYRLRVLDYRALKKIFGPKGEGATVDWGKNCIVVNFVSCAVHQILYTYDQIENSEMGGACGAYEGEEKYIQISGVET